MVGLTASTLSCTALMDSREKPGALVVIVIDTLRGDRLGFAGYEHAVTPTLDSLAVAGTRFREAVTPVPMTLPATASLFTGLYPFRHGVRDNDGFALAGEQQTLAERFRDAGYRTGAVLGSAVLDPDRGLDQGFETYDTGFGGEYPVYTRSLVPLQKDLAGTRRRADVVTDLAMERLGAFGEEPFFLFVHYFDVHMHYDPPPRFAALHPGRPYDGEVSFVDHEIGRLLDALARRPDALVVVTADHGESQGEHGEPQHGFLLYQSTLHVPLIVSGPGVPAGAVREDPASLIDLEPTLARVFELEEPAASRDGRALRWEEPAPDVPLYAETFHPLTSQGWSELRSIRLGDWKLVSGPRSELYDLAGDPRELHDLGDADPAARLADVLATMVGDDDPEEVFLTARGGSDPERRKLLESLGYVGGSNGSSDLLAERPHPADELPGWLDEQWSRTLLRDAAVLAEADKLAEARTLVDSVLVLAPDYTDAYYLRGELARQRGDRAAAAAAYGEAVSLDPQHLRAQAGLAALAEEEGRMNEALERWKLVFMADAAHVPALVFLSSWYLRKSAPGKALPFLRRLVSQRPMDAAARFNLGLTAFRTEREEEARRHLEIFLRLAPDSPQAADAQTILEEITPGKSSEESAGF